MSGRRIEIIGYDSGWGCRDYKCEDGPHQIRIDRILHDLSHLGHKARWNGTLGLRSLGNHDELNDKEKTLPLVSQGLHRLNNMVGLAVEKGHVPVVIGGDHASAIGTWSGTTTKLDACENFGLIWIDAHLDAHTPETAHEGKWGGWWHGMPLAALTGNGESALTHVGNQKKKINPQHISVIGLRSFEPSEKAYAKKHGINVYTIEDVKKRGFGTIWAEAVTRATTNTRGFGLSIDLDGFDPADAPGVGTREPNGLRAADVLPIISGLGQNDAFKALEIVEFNPHNDVGDATNHLIERLISSIFQSSD